MDVRGTPESIDGPWMTSVLERAGVARGATVTDVAIERFIGTGQMGRTARLALTWDDPEGRPQTVVGKFPTDDPTTKATAFAGGSYRNEWEFYSSLGATVKVRTPACHAALFDDAIPAFALIFEDLKESRQGDQFEGLTVDEAALGIEQAVALHAPRWGDPTLDDVAAHRARGEERGTQLGMIVAATSEIFLTNIGPRLDAEVIDLVRRVVPRIPQWIAAADLPLTVVHNDFRPDNLLFGTTPQAPPLAVVDWQTVGQGNAMWDVAYLIGGSFEADVRARVERDLFEDYRARLGAEGVELESERGWRNYRIASLWGLVMAVIASVLAERTERGDAMFAVMAQRHGHHALDLEALDLVA
jgi:hypothetical protein